MKQFYTWILALVIGALFGWLSLDWLNAILDFVATVYTRLFQFLAVPTLVLTIATTLASITKGQDIGRVFRHTIIYTLLTTAAASAVGLLLFVTIAPGVLPDGIVSSFVSDEVMSMRQNPSYTEHILRIVPNNFIAPFLAGDVLSLLLIASAIGLALSVMPASEPRTTVINFLRGILDVLLTLIRALIRTLPLGIAAFTALLVVQLRDGIAAEALGRYTLVVLGSNLLQFFVVLPLFLLSRGLNPLKVLGGMMPAVLTALFTKSSVATLPVTVQSAEQRVGVNPKISRFILPICTTINMNGCAAFILITSLFVMQQSGITLTWGTMALWFLLSIISAVGNAGVPMGCYFLTFSLMTGVGANVAVLGLILPIYTVIDMVETAVNVWSDSCVCTMTNHDLSEE